MRYLLILGLCAVSSLLAKCSEVPEETRKFYANNMYKAFQLQCQGKSIAAWSQFASAYQHAKDSGEDIRRLQVIEQILVWYRTYGTASRLFAQQPTGYDKIRGEYQRPYGYYPRMHIEPDVYRSELGTTRKSLSRLEKVRRKHEENGELLG